MRRPFVMGKNVLRCRCGGARGGRLVIASCSIRHNVKLFGMFRQDSRASVIQKVEEATRNCQGQTEPAMTLDIFALKM